jgi:hypothetical protein
MAYSNVQFIGYVIDTAPQLNPDTTQTYLGLNNPQQDIEARCELFRRAVETAAASLPHASPPEPPGVTLKVFMAPEFFFRGAAGAYRMDDVQLLVEALQQMAAGDQWADWVFVFGTIVGTSSPTTGVPPYTEASLKNKEIYNFALVQQGGVDGRGDAGARVVMKELKSGIDFIAAAANPGGLLLGEVDPLAVSKVGGPGRERQKVNYDGAGIFQLQGVTWALDICLDHLGTVRRLQRSPQLPGDEMVQLQLVPSCGMSIQAASVVCENGGLVFNCDGLRNTRHSALARQVPPLANLALAHSVAVPGGAVALHSPPLHVPIASLYASGSGVVNVYPTQPLPQAQTVQGSVVKLVWRTGDDWTFKFLLVYAPNGAFVTAMCEVVSKLIDFHGNNYYLPLAIFTQDSMGRDVQIQMNLAAGSGTRAGAVWCKINVPGFIFEGNAFQFSAQAAGLPPDTIW